MTYSFKLACIAARTLEDKLTARARPSDVHTSARNTASGEFCGTVIQIGTVQGDLNVHETRSSDDDPPVDETP
ncbi:hypothetical protein ACFFQW_30740 [Umezawaea endophytica]|uniref:Uncharacterized protein n=1 Tax=Umezawaea endophytica TaxID=1654476 RepID=A0A9X2VUJ9_9PSEU|nr:hypothetical protein [Umezawaea endophytica]MCS7482906.1 hypothetical protein [Umezawaea endophytica]